MRCLLVGGGYLSPLVVGSLREKGLDPILLSSGEAASELSLANSSAHTPKAEVVIQLAGPSKITLEGPAHSSEIELIRYLNLTETVSKFALQRGVPLVLVSSISVYGARLSGMVAESTAIRPSGIYGLSRFAAECAARAQFAEWPSGLKILRVSNAMGLYPDMPNHSKELLGNSMLIAAVTKADFHFHGDPAQHRVFSSLRRVVDEISAVVAQPGRFEQVTNVGSGKSMAISELRKSLVAGQELSTGNAQSDFVFCNSRDWFGDQAHLTVFDELVEARKMLGHYEDL